MTDEEFIDKEEEFLSKMDDFVNVCNEYGVDPQERIEDLICRAIE